MATTFNFLSGSSIDNSSNFLFRALNSGKIYLGFARGEKTIEDLLTPPNIQWGVNSLLYVEYKNENFENIVATENDTPELNKFFDTNSIRNTSCSAASTDISIYCVPNTATSLLGLLPIYSGLKLNFIGKSWMLIEGLPQDYYTIMSQSTSANYYVVNTSEFGFDIAAKILTKSFVNVPFYSSECVLYSNATSAVVLSGIQRLTNIIGESYVIGLQDPASILDTDINAVFRDSTVNKESLLLDTFILQDVNGNVLIDNMTFVNPNNTVDEIYFELVSPEGDTGNVSKYITFKYNYANIEGQYIKFIVGNRQIDELGIWNEHLPFESTIPSSDANPPGLEVSFLKNPLIVDSIFDVKGMYNIPVSGIYYIKEMASINDVLLYTNPTSAGGYNFEKEIIELNGSGVEHIGSVKSSTIFGSSIINLNNYHNFVVGDTFYLPNPTTLYTISAVSYEINNSNIEISTTLLNELNANEVIVSLPTSAATKITIAKTQNMSKALQYGFNSAMINCSVDLTGSNSPTEDVYRQLFISYNSFDASGNQMTNPIYTAATYETDQIFNKSTLQYDLGTILYIANKIPLYRRFATSTSGKEEFKIIL